MPPPPSKQSGCGVTIHVDVENAVVIKTLQRKTLEKNLNKNDAYCNDEIVKDMKNEVGIVERIKELQVKKGHRIAPFPYYYNSEVTGWNDTGSTCFRILMSYARPLTVDELTPDRYEDILKAYTKMLFCIDGNIFLWGDMKLDNIGVHTDGKQLVFFDFDTSEIINDKYQLTSYIKSDIRSEILKDLLQLWQSFTVRVQLYKTERDAGVVWETHLQQHYAPPHR